MTTREFALKFESTANAIAARYGAKVWLVGSALSKKNPRDYDVRVILRDEDLQRLFGADLDWGIKRDNLKQSRIYSSSMQLPLDFQLQTREVARRYSSHPKMRLDKAPEDFFEAGLI
jgi:hypothetical protein